MSLGEFTCNSCHTTFDKSNAEHGASGYCCQCEIALGLIEIHSDPELNRLERERGQCLVQMWNLAFKKN